MSRGILNDEELATLDAYKPSADVMARAERSARMAYAAESQVPLGPTTTVGVGPLAGAVEGVCPHGMKAPTTSEPDGDRVWTFEWTPAGCGPCSRSNPDGRLRVLQRYVRYPAPPQSAPILA